MAKEAHMTWPGYVRNTFRAHASTPATWPVVLEQCIRNDIKDAKLITDVIFYLHVHDNHGWGPIKEDQTELRELWQFFNKIVKKRLSPGYKLPVGPYIVDHEKWTIRYLEAVDCDKLGKNKDHIDRLKKVKDLLSRGYEGKLDKSNFEYWIYKHSTANGMFKDAAAAGKVQWVKRDGTNNLLSSFKKRVERADVPGKVMPNILRSLESEIFTNTEVLLRWKIDAGGTADAKLKSYTEVTFIEEMIELGNSSNHVYSIYKSPLKDALDGINALPD